MLLEQNRDWARLALVLVAAAAFLLIYKETVGDLLALWTSEGNPTYSHGPLLLLVCGVLAYKRSKASRLALKDRPDPLGLLLVFGLSLTWFAAALAQVQIVQYLCLVFLLLALFHVLFGVKSFRVYGLPVLLMLFSIPLWEVFSGMLQWVTVGSVEFLLNASGIPSVANGITIEVPAGMFRVEESCSGLGQFIVAGAVAIIFADTLKLNFRKSLLVVPAALAVAVISNIIRVYIVVVAGQLTQMRHPFVTDHYTLGWVLFGGLLFVFLFVTAGYFRHTEVPRDPDAFPPQGRLKPFSSGALLLVAVPCLVALTGPLLLSMLNTAAKSGDHVSLSLPAEVGSWQRTAGFMPGWRTRFSGYDDSDAGRYSNGAGDVQLIVYQYTTQRQGKEAVSDSNAVYEDTAEPLGGRVVSSGMGRIGSIQERLFRQGFRKQLVWYWYQAVGKGTANPLFAKMLGVWGRLIDEPSVRVFIVTTDATRSVNAARNELEDFTRALSSTAWIEQ